MLRAAVEPEAIVAALGQNHGVLLANGGALCCGATEADTAALALVAEKNAHAALIPTFFPGKEAQAVPLACLLYTSCGTASRGAFFYGKVRQRRKGVFKWT